VVWAVSLLLVLIPASLAILVYGLRSGPGVTKENFDRLEDGMPFDAVAAVLGPPGDESPGGRNWSLLHNGVMQIGHTRRVWAGDDGAARIEFDEHDRVHTKTWVDDPEPFARKVRRWFRWLPL
jgi:hypothetical protein